MAKTPLRMGLIGCGTITQMMHLPHMQEYDEFEVIALADMNEAALNAVGDAFHIANRYTDYHALLARKDIDAVGVFTSGDHTAPILAALDAGKHVLTEKPMCYTVSQADAIVEKVRQTGLTLQVAYHKRYDEGYRYGLARVKEMRGIEFARVTVLHPMSELSWTPYRIRRGNDMVVEGFTTPPPVKDHVAMMRWAFAGGPHVSAATAEMIGTNAPPHIQLGFGLLNTSVIHQINATRGLLGTPARVVNTNIWKDGLCIHTQWEYPDGLRCSIDWVYLHNLNDYREEYALFGHEDRVQINFPSPWLKNAPTPVVVQGGDNELAWEKKVTVTWREAFLLEILEFYDNVMNHKTPLTSAEDTREDVKLVKAIMDAVQ